MIQPAGPRCKVHGVEVDDEDRQLKDTIVVDLDGTLANIDHRLHYVKREKPDWDAFYAACDKDTPNEWCLHLLQAFHESFYQYEVLIVSARRKSEQIKTMVWMRSHNVRFDQIFLLREDGNHEEDTVLKKRWLDRYGKDRILFVVDDRQKVVDMWRAEGLVCLQCYAWKEHK